MKQSQFNKHYEIFTMKIASIFLILLSSQAASYSMNLSLVTLGILNNDTVVVKHKTGDTILVSSSNDRELAGIDVSDFQGEVDWTLISQQPIYFVFIKSSQGRYTIDKEYQRNWKQTAQQKLLRGVYHYLDPSVDATAQAEHFINTTQGDFGDFPPAIDIEAFENQTTETVIQVLDAFINHLEDQFDCKPIIYTSPGFWNQLKNNHYGDYPLWLADYGKQPQLPNGWEDWTFWQFESNGTVSGIKGHVDRSKFTEGIQALHQLKCKKPA